MLMFIYPNTTIKILKDCPLDPTYDHTLWFDSKDGQTAYFQSLVKFDLTNQSYQRVERGKMRIEKKAEDLFDCNYLMFRNHSFGDKIFYAFITGVEYINNITSEITFEIDVMQTWFFDYQLKECFVEREHHLTDRVGENLVPENLELGDYVVGEAQTTNLMSNRAYHYLVATSVDESGTDVAGSKYGGIYSGLTYLAFDNIDKLNSYIDKITELGKRDGIISIIPLPAYLDSGGSWTSESLLKTISVPKHSSLGGYTPKNYKLYTYPYTFLYVTNLQGNSAVFKYEYFNRTDTCNFVLGCDISPNPTFVLAPDDYNYESEHSEFLGANFDEKITLSGFPQCSWTTDTYKAWLAQNASSIYVNSLATVGTAALGVGGALAMSNPVTAGLALGGALLSLHTDTANVLSQAHQQDIKPPQANGGGGSQMLAAFRLLDFWFANKHIRPEFAKIIDDYFDMYGYATHLVKVPNTHSRPHWNFVKTIGCVITGSIPSDDVKTICEIYNKGITFWKKGEEVGNYSLNNRPT